MKGENFNSLDLHLKALLLFLFFFLSLAVTDCAFAQESAKTTITLKEVVERTLKNNIPIAFQVFNSQIKAQDVMDKRAEFDPTLGLELSIQEKTRQSSSSSSSNPKNRNKDHTWDLSLEQKILKGADYELNFSSDRKKTNYLKRSRDQHFK